MPDVKRKAQYLTQQQVYGIALRAASDIADIYGVDARSLARAATAIAQVESNYNINAKNKHSTARGIGQLLEKTQKWIEDKFMRDGNHPDEIWNPEYSIKLMEHYLGYQYNRYDKDWRKAIYAYNQGSYSPVKTAGNGYVSKWNIALASQPNNDKNLAYNPGTTFYLEFM